MKKWGNRFIIWSIILIVGPFFGLTLKGFGEIDYSGHILGAIFFFVIGYIFKQISKSKEENNICIMEKEYQEPNNYERIENKKENKIESIKFNIKYVK